MGSLLLEYCQGPAPAREFTGDCDVGDGWFLATLDELHPPLVESSVAFVAAGSCCCWSLLPTVAHGLAQRIDVVETGASAPVISDVDIVLLDTFGQIQGEGIDLEDLVRDSGAKVVIYSWNLEPRLINQAIAAGASGYLSKVLTGPQIVCALERVMNGETIILTGDHETSVGGEGDWPGRSTGLSSREAEMLALITQGLSNEDVGRRAFLSKNSVKTYIRSAYRKIGVTSRTQAVLWAIDNGFKPDTLRTLDPALLVRPPRGSTRPAPPENTAPPDCLAPRP